MDLQVKQKMAEGADRERWWPAARRLVLRNLFQRHLPASQTRRVLEAGCGPGWNLSLLSEFGEVMAIDSDATIVSNARKVEPDAVVLHGCIPDTVINHEFDLICFLDVLEHIEDDQAALDWACSMLAPGGCLCISVPAFPFLWSRHDVASHHFRRYRMAQLETLLGKRFRILHKNHFNFWLFPFSAIAAVIRRLARIPHSHFREVKTAPKTLKNSRVERTIGGLLYAVLASERHIVGRLRIPFGVSAFILAQRL